MSANLTTRCQQDRRKQDAVNNRAPEELCQLFHTQAFPFLKECNFIFYWDTASCILCQVCPTGAQVTTLIPASLPHRFLIDCHFIYRSRPFFPYLSLHKLANRLHDSIIEQ